MNNITQLTSLSLLMASSLLSNAAFSKDYDAIMRLPKAQQFSLPVSGMIEEVNVRPGQRTAKGEEIIVLDQGPFKVAVIHAKANVTVQQSKSKEAQRDLEHHKELYDRTVLSTVDLENVEMREERARAHLADAKTKLSVANYELAHSKLISPFDALILSLHVNPGQYLNNRHQAQPLVSVVRQGEYQLTFDVALEDNTKFALDQNVTVTIKGVNYSAKISGINYQTVENANATDNKISVTADLVERTNQMLMGHKAIVRID